MPQTIVASHRGVAQLASALAWGARGRVFESHHPDTILEKALKSYDLRAFLFGLNWFIACIRIATVNQFEILTENLRGEFTSQLLNGIVMYIGGEGFTGFLPVTSAEWEQEDDDLYSG